MTELWKFWDIDFTLVQQCVKTSIISVSLNIFLVFPKHLTNKQGPLTVPVYQGICFWLSFFEMEYSGLNFLDLPEIPLNLMGGWALWQYWCCKCRIASAVCMGTHYVINKCNKNDDNISILKLHSQICIKNKLLIGPISIIPQSKHHKRMTYILNGPNYVDLIASEITKVCRPIQDWPLSAFNWWCGCLSCLGPNLVW